MMLDDCRYDGADAGVGDLVAWAERAPRQADIGGHGGQRWVMAWITHEAGTGLRRVLTLEVAASTGYAAYVAGAVLRRRATGLLRHGLRRQARVGEADGPKPAEQLSFPWL